MSIGIALPPFFFTKDKKVAPLVLLVLAFCGLALPILAMALYLWRSEGWVGANKVSQQTVAYYQRFGVKEMLRVTKMPEAIVPAQEFVSMPLRKETVRGHCPASHCPACIAACQVLSRPLPTASDDTGRTQ